MQIRTLLAAGFALVALLVSGCGYAKPGTDETKPTPSSGTTTSGDGGY